MTERPDGVKIEGIYRNGVLVQTREFNRPDGATILTNIGADGRPVNGTKTLSDGTEISLTWKWNNDGSYSIKEHNNTTNEEITYNYNANDVLVSSFQEKDGVKITGTYTDGVLTKLHEEYPDKTIIDRDIENGICYHALKTLPDGTKIKMEYNYKSDGSYSLTETNQTTGDVTRYDINADGQITFAHTDKADGTKIDDEYENGIRVKSTEIFTDGSKNIKFFMTDGREKYEERYSADNVLTKLGFTYNRDGSYTITEATPSTGEVIIHNVDANGNKTSNVLVSAADVKEAEDIINGSHSTLIDKISSLVNVADGADVQSVVETALRQAIQDFRENKSIGYLRYHIANLIHKAGHSSIELQQALDNRTAIDILITELSNALTHTIKVRNSQESALNSALADIEKARTQDSGSSPVPQDDTGAAENNNPPATPTPQTPKTYTRFYDKRFSQEEYTNYCKENFNNADAFYEVTGANGVKQYKLKEELTQEEYEKLGTIKSYFS